MRGLLSALFLVGFSGSSFSQPLGVCFDTVLISPDGGVVRQSFYSFGDFGFTGIVKNFEEAQRQLIDQVNEDHERFRANWEQRKKEERELARRQLNGMRIALFTEVIGLTEAEAEKFWPLYNKYSEEKAKIDNNRFLIVERIKNPTLKLSDQDIEQLTNNYVTTFKQDSDLTQEYYKRFRSILTPQKVLLLYRAENEFKAQMLRRLRSGGF